MYEENWWYNFNEYPYHDTIKRFPYYYLIISSPILNIRIYKYDFKCNRNNLRLCVYFGFLVLLMKSSTITKVKNSIKWNVPIPKCDKYHLLTQRVFFHILKKKLNKRCCGKIANIKHDLVLLFCTNVIDLKYLWMLRKFT